MVNNCDKCFKEMKDTDEVFEVNDNYVCLDCLDDLNNKYENMRDDINGK